MANLSLTFAPCPEQTPQLGAAEAHVWQVDLANFSDNLLSASEYERALSMHHPEKQAHFIAARSALRLILAKYSGRDPKALVLGTEKNGKPILADESGLQFNVTHAQGKALIAIAHVAVGIDLEFPRAVSQLDKLVEHYFAPDEQREFANMSQEEKATAFLAAWTRKEACLKATGEGVAGGLHRYRVTLRNDEEAKLVAIDGQVEAARAWCLHAFACFGDGQAAICAKSSALNVTGYML